MSDEFMPEIPFFKGESRHVRRDRYYEQPAFSVKEAARFFDRSSWWLRNILREEEMMTNADGSEIEVDRWGTHRVFTYETLRDIAQSLYGKKRISKAHYNLVARRISAFYAEK